MKVGGYETANWKVCNKELSVGEIRVYIKYGLPTSMQDELEDNQEDYCSLTREDWWDLLSTIESKIIGATQIKKISSARVSFHSDSD